ncbi:hypothetical protein [Actinoplanes sp. NPDC026670]|uniref:NucA/NucB deoxyribonuclease domain-containing protein n=1 Tax=Actinoplanes sp. NPDC026670 TaxID=3154700 RepID=UPI0033CE36A8
MTAAIIVMAPTGASAEPVVPTPPANSGSTGIATKPASVPDYTRHSVTVSPSLMAEETCTTGKVSVCVRPIKPEARAVAPQLSAASVIPFPQWCADSPGTPVSASRTEACEGGGLIYTTRQTVNGVTTITGEVSMNVFNYTFSAVDLPNWQHQIGIAPYSGWGAAAGATISATFGVDGDCHTLGAPQFTPQLISPINNVMRTGTAGAETTATAVGALGSCTTSWQVTFTTPAHPAASASFDMQEIACDNATGANGFRPRRVGCVVFWFPATVFYSQGSYPELASHVARAQASGLPGHGFDAPLHRNETAATVDLNRSRACGGAPSITGKSCDEYPLASTYEGLAFGGTLRTFPGCNISAPTNVTGASGASACMITASQNNAQGALMAAFYYDYRVLAGDPYLVDISS